MPALLRALREPLRECAPTVHPDGGSIELGTPDPAAVFGHAGMALAVSHAPFKVRWIQLPSEGIPVAVTTYSRYHPGGAMVAVAGI